MKLRDKILYTKEVSLHVQNFFLLELILFKH